MLKIFKSIIVSYYVYRLKRNLVTIVFLVLLIVILNFIYNDLKDYLTLIEAKNYIIYLIITKWILILSCLYTIIKLITFKSNKKNKKVKPTSNLVEQRLLNKSTLKNKSDFLIERKIIEKSKNLK